LCFLMFISLDAGFPALRRQDSADHSLKVPGVLDRLSLP
jgi:hypothetical protein